MADRTALSHHVLVIGAGSTGAAVAHDLALRGFAVTVVERGAIASGTTGRNHCLLHSGARYCMSDPVSAQECAQENDVLRSIMPQAMELNGGLFVALTEEHLAYKSRFQEACRSCGIEAHWLTPEQVLALEPHVHPKNLGAFHVPDGVFDPLRFCLSFLATAKRNGADVLPFTRVDELILRNSAVEGVKVYDLHSNCVNRIEADLVVNAAGPWAGEISSLAGVKLPMDPTPGVMVSMRGRFCQRVINRLGLPSDGDIVVPQRETSILGTTSWSVQQADYIPIPDDHVELLLERGRALIPSLADSEPQGIFTVARPLIHETGKETRQVSRGFECFDHADDGVQGLVTIVGGKTSTSRAMAETTADLVCSKLDIRAPCRTRETRLESYRAFYYP
jgi:glycerol-3-phosphate dehydrogenase